MTIQNIRNGFFLIFLLLYCKHKFFSLYFCYVQMDPVQIPDAVRIDHLLGIPLKRDGTVLQANDLLGKMSGLVNIMEHHDNGDAILFI